MPSNAPPGADYDPRAPWQSHPQEPVEKEYEPEDDDLEEIYDEDETTG